MRVIFNKFLVKKFISVFAAIAILMTALPINTFFTKVGAAGNSSVIDFEGSAAWDIVDGNDEFSIAGIDDPNKYYFYAKNNTSDTLTLTLDNLQLDTDKKYTIDFDVYTLRLSEDADNRLIGLKIYGENETVLDVNVNNDKVFEEYWANYHTDFTAKESENKLDFSLFTIGKVLIDNFVIIDEDGNELALDLTAACEATELKDHFGMATLYDIAYDEPDIIDGYLKAAIAENTSITYNEKVDIPMNLDAPLEDGHYTMSVDLKFTSLGTNRISFCASIAGNNVDTIQHFIEAEDIIPNSYYTYTYDFDLTSDYSWFRFHVYQGCTAYIDDVVLLDAAGQEVVRFDFDEVVNFNGSAFEQKGIAKSKSAMAFSLKNIAAASASTDDYAFLADNSNGTGNISYTSNQIGQPYPITTAGTYTVEFDFYALSAGNQIVSFVTIDSGWGNMEQYYTDQAGFIENEWVTISFTTTASKDISFWRMYLGAGVKGYIDNVRFIDSNGNEVVNYGMSENENGKTVTGVGSVVALPVAIAEAKAPDEPEDILLSGMNIAILRGRANSDGATIKLGGSKSPLTIKSNTSYKLSFKYYQANPTDSGVLNLFGIDTGFGNDIAYFKKNNSIGWTTGTVLFTTGDVTNASVDWFEIILGANAWVYFDDFKLVEQAIDNNKAINIIDFEEKDDSIYPDAKVNDCTFGQTNDFSGASNGSNGYFCASNATEYTNATNNSSRSYDFSGIKFKSNTTYRVSIDYYVSKPFEDYAFAFGYNAKNLGVSSSEAAWQLWVNNKSVVGWDTVSFTVTTGEVVPNASYIKLAFYDVANSAEPRVIYFDNLTLTELYKVDTSVNDASLGTVSKSDTVEGGDDAKVMAHPYDGVTFEGWYEYGDLISKEQSYTISGINDNHKLVAHFSGEAVKPSRIVQSFEDYDIGEVEYEYYNIVEDPDMAFDGDKVLHVSPEKIEDELDSSIFFPVISSIEEQLKDDYNYDLYVWIKPVNNAESKTYFQVVHSITRDLSDMIHYGELAGSGIQRTLTPSADTALETTEDGWCKYLIGTVSKTVATKDGFGLQICKFHAGRPEGASIDEMYIDCIEVVERAPDFENMKYTEALFNEISNSDFEDEITNENWAPLTEGMSVENVTDKEYDWQGDKQLVFDAAKSNGEEYVRVIPIEKQGKNYTFAAWTKLSTGSDIELGLYKNDNYESFTNVVNGEDGTLKLVDDGKWNRVSFTFNTGDSENAYLVIRGTKGTLQLDMVEMFLAIRGYLYDPNAYGMSNTVLQMTNPIAFPDIIRSETSYTYSETVGDDNEATYDNYEDTDDNDKNTENAENTDNIKRRKRVVSVISKGGTSPWVWVGIGACALVVIAAVTIFIVMVKKRRQGKKEVK